MKSLLKKFIPPRWRPMGIVRELVRVRTNCQVAEGPFAGMRYVDAAAGSAYVPKLLGIYERELYPTIESIITSGYNSIIDIGAAEGYYAVGLARRLPAATIYAFEMNEHARLLLADMAHANGVADRVIVLGACDLAGLNATLQRPGPHLVICDAEGAEQTLLQPAAVPGLAAAAILVELHEMIVRGVTEQIRERFQATHDIQQIWSTERQIEDFPYRNWATKILPKKFIRNSIREFRPEQMPWFWMTPRTTPSQL